MLAVMHRCKWDAVNQVLITKDQLAQAEKTKAFEGVAWFRDEFGLLGQNTCNQKRYVAPKALFNLDDAGLCRTIHDRHQAPRTSEDTNVQAGTPPRRARKKLVDLTTAKGDSASHTSSSSLEDSSLSNKGLCSKAFDDEQDSSSVTNGG